MSYDVSIGQFDRNYTSNAGKLFHQHILNTNGESHRTGLQALDGCTGYAASIILAAAWDSINRERHSLWNESLPGEPAMERKYNAPNGWGSLVGALVFLGEITAACGQYPTETVSVSA